MNFVKLSMDESFQYSILSSLFIIIFLIVFQPFGIDRNSLEALLIGIIFIGSVHFITIFFSKKAVSLITGFKVKQNFSLQLTSLSIFVLLTALLTKLAHSLIGFSTLSLSESIEWIVKSFLVLPLPHLLYLLIFKKQIWSPGFSNGLKNEKVFRSLHSDLENLDPNLISHIKALQNYSILFRLENGALKKTILPVSLKELEKNLLCSPFLRVQRSYILNIRYLKEIRGNSKGHKAFLNIENEIISIPVSIKKLPLLTNIFKKY